MNELKPVELTDAELDMVAAGAQPVSGDLIETGGGLQVAVPLGGNNTAEDAISRHLHIVALDNLLPLGPLR